MARRNKREEKEIARERIVRLVALAQEAAKASLPARASRYAQLAWKIKTTYQVRPSEIDRRRCRACGGFLSAGTSRVRLRAGVRVTTCLACGHVRRNVLAG